MLTRRALNLGILASAGLVAAAAPAASEDVKVIDLPSPWNDGGKPLAQALWARRSIREYADKPVPIDRDDALRVPDQALRYAPAGVQAGEHEAGPRVWVLREGKPIAVSVKTDLDDETFTEIVGGELRAGDAVVVGEERGEPSTRGALPMPRL